MKKILILILLYTCSLFATNYYVSESGSSGNNGLSWGSAKSGPHDLYSTLVAGDTVFIAEGKYKLYTDLSGPICANDGAAGNPIVFYGVGDPAKIILHDLALTGGAWSVYSGNIYELSVTLGNTSYPNILYQNYFPLKKVGSIGAVDEPGEYFDNGSNAYAWFFDNGNPANYTIHKAAQYSLLELRTAAGDNYIHFYNITFTGAYNNLVNGYTSDSSTKNDIKFFQCIFWGGLYNIQFYPNDFDSCGVYNCNFYNYNTSSSGVTSLVLLGSGITNNTNEIYNCIFNGGYQGIYQQTTTDQIHNYNIFYDFNSAAVAGNGSLEANEITGEDPLFYDAPNISINLRLNIGSPGVDAGIYSGEVSDKLTKQGANKDIGVYERKPFGLYFGN